MEGRLVVHWLVFFAIILGFSIGAAFLAQIVLYKLALLLGAFFQLIRFADGLRYLSPFVEYGTIAIEMFVAGFLYFLFIEPDYRKAGAIVCLLITGFHVALRWPPAEETLRLTAASPRFYLGLAIGLMAAIYGAWLADENRTNENLKLAVDTVLSFIGL